MRKLYIHIGTPKTATTSLQFFFEKNKEVLLKDGIYYPIWTDWIVPDNPLYDHCGNYGWVTRGFREENIKRVAEAFCMSDTVLLSSECVWGEVYDKGEWLRELTTVADEVVIIVYLRNQIDYLESFYRELVRVGGQKRSDIIEFKDGKYSFTISNNSNYYSVLRGLSEIENVTVVARPFEVKFLKRNNILIDFLMNIGIDRYYDYNLENVHLNQTMMDTTLLIKEIMNDSSECLVVDDINRSFFDTLMILDKKMKNNRPIMSEEEREWVFNYFKEENMKLATEYFEEDYDGYFSLSTYSKRDGSTTVRSIDLQEEMDEFIHLYTVKVVSQDKQIENSCKKIEKLEKKMMELEDIKKSKSWKITAPLRKIDKIVHRKR